MGLDGLLRHARAALTGILNGIDTRCGIRRPTRASPRTYDVDNLAGARRQQGGAAASGSACDPRPTALLLGVVSRLSWQKGLDLLLETLPVLRRDGIQLALLGVRRCRPGGRASGRPRRSHPGQIGVVIGYDEDLAHLIQAGADALLVPSRFEPCGLTQLCALRYGAFRWWRGSAGWPIP